ncbi:MAG: diguanylate cyclase [Methylophaga sp.]|nr:diguanylate cyclase [Methylophaga sp.]
MADHALNRSPSEAALNPHGTVVEAIQSSGCLLRFDATMQDVRQVSANLAEHLDIAVDSALRSTALDLLGQTLHSQVQSALQNQDRLLAALVIQRLVRGHHQRFYVMAYRSQNDVVVEFEYMPRADEQRLLPVVNEWLTRLAACRDIKQLLQILTQSVQVVTGYDRVMLCEFDRHSHRIVVAESCMQPERSLLHYHLPAIDIPEMVRNRYAENPLRNVPDVLAEPVPLVPSHDAQLPLLDMTYGYLRALSDRHKAYLQNLGVSAVLTIAIHSHKGLWGLLVCHSFTPMALSPVERDAAFNLVQMASQRLFLLQHLQEAAFLQQVLDSRELLSAERGLISQPGELFKAHGNGWLKLFGLCGMALVYGDSVTCYAETLDVYEIDIVAKWLGKQYRDEKVWCCQRLSVTELNDLVDLRDRAGLMAVRLPGEAEKNGWMLMFRKSRVRQYQWLASQTVLSAFAEGELVRQPDLPGEVWTETITDRCAAWRGIEQKAAMDLAEDLTVAISVNEISQLNKRFHQANDQLKKIAHTDSLTQVWNRYRIEQAIDAELSAAERYYRPCSILLFDVDHFKKVNDQHGHEVGDLVLKRLTSEVEKQLRATDFLGRWGGEEFIVLASNNTLDEAGNLAERLLKHVASIKFTDVGQVTVSIGVAQWRTGESRRSLLERADKAMYRAKQNGRNRFEFAQ